MSTWKEDGFTAWKSKDGWMYILPSFKNLCHSVLIKDHHWVEDSKTAYDYCKKKGIDVRLFAPQNVVFAPILGKRERKIKKKEEGIY